MERSGDANEEYEEFSVVDYDVFYTDSENDLGMKPGWYFWFLDQDNNIVSEPVGPWDDPEEAMRSGKAAVNAYYDHDNEERSP